MVFGLVVVAALSRGLCERVFKLPQVRLARLGLPAGLAGADLGEDLGEALVHLRLVQLILVERKAVHELLDGPLRAVGQERKTKGNVAPLPLLGGEPEALAQLLDHILSLPLLVDEGEDELHRIDEHLLLHGVLADGQVADDIGQVIVHGVLLSGKLAEEELGQIAHPWLLVLETLGQLAQLALDLDHTVED